MGKRVVVSYDLEVITVEIYNHGICQLRPIQGLKTPEGNLAH